MTEHAEYPHTQALNVDGVPTAFIEALTRHGAVPFIGTAGPRGGASALTRSIGAVALTITPQTAKQIIALADVVRFAQRLLGTMPTITVPCTVLAWLHTRARTTLPDVMVRSALEEADETGQCILADITEVLRALDATGVKIDTLAATMSSVTVDPDADVAHWLLLNGDFVVVSAPLPMATLRQIAAGGVALGLLDAEDMAGTATVHIVHETWKGLSQDPALFTTVQGAAGRMAHLAREHRLTVGHGGDEITIDEIEAGGVGYVSDAEQNAEIHIYSIPLAKIGAR